MVRDAVRKKQSPLVSADRRGIRHRDLERRWRILVQQCFEREHDVDYKFLEPNVFLWLRESSDFCSNKNHVPETTFLIVKLTRLNGYSLVVECD